MAKMLAHRETATPVLHEVRAGVPEELSAIFEKMVAKNPEDRYQTTTALLKALEVVAREIVEEEEPVSSATPSSNALVDLQSKETSSASLVDTINLQPKAESVAVDTPQLGLPAAGGRGRRNIVIGGIATVAVAIFAWLYFAGIIFKVQTKDGLIVIETNVTDVEVLVDGQKVVKITDPKDEKKIKVEVKPGAKLLTVSKEGFEAEVSSFTLKTVKGPIKVTFVPKSSPSGGVDREVAEMVLRDGGWVRRTLPDGRSAGIKTADDYPVGSFHINAIYLQGPSTLSCLNQLQQLDKFSLSLSSNPLVSDQTLKTIQPLDITTLQLIETAITDDGLRHVPQTLGSIYLNDTSIGDDGFKYLSSLPRLAQIEATNTKATDAGIKHFTNSRLNYLNLSGCSGITDETLKHVKDVPLNWLYLANTQVTNAGLVHLQQQSLGTLDLTGTKVTAAGVAELQKALPNCEIIFGDIDRQVAE